MKLIVTSPNLLPCVIIYHHVADKPRFAKKQPHVVFSWSGRVHNITCEPQGEPTPSIEWRRQDRPLENNDTYRIFNVGNFSNLQVLLSSPAIRALPMTENNAAGR